MSSIKISKTSLGLKYLLPSILILAFLLPNFSSFALTPQEEKQLLEQELKDLEEKIAKYENNINITQQERKTLQNQVSILKTKINKLNLQIQQSSVIIKDVGLQIKDTEGSIDITGLKIEESKENLSDILRTVYEERDKSSLEILLAKGELSDFFENLFYLENLSAESSDLLQNIKTLKSDLEEQKQDLDEEKGDLESTLKMQILQKQESELTKLEKDSLLEKTKGKESLYQQYLTESKKRAAEIRQRIFELSGVSKAPTFGEALEIAKYVEGITKVRPAFLLAVLTQESNIGKNVGQCNLVNPKTGEGKRINGGEILPKTMSPTRDVPIFLSITQALGRDPYSTPVSCPMSFGWGGAMGPAQFIPSTWNLYDERVKAITGKNADPWDIKDAFLAAALYLADYGASSQTSDNEWKAAMIYFSGSTKSKYRFYGDSVIATASRYENDIRTIENAK